MPVLKLFILYDEPEPLPVPDIKERTCTLKLSAAAIFIHLSIKAQATDYLAFKLPVALLKHYEFLQHLPVKDLNVPASLRQDFLVPLICNTYSTSQDLFQVFGLTKRIIFFVALTSRFSIVILLVHIVATFKNPWSTNLCIIWSAMKMFIISIKIFFQIPMTAVVRTISGNNEDGKDVK
jgi:hypothetical protein